MAVALPWIAAATGIYSAVKGANAQDKAAENAGKAGQAAQINIDQLNEQVQNIAKQNAALSKQLEDQYSPEVGLLRTAANNGVLGQLGQSQGETQALSMLQGRLGQEINPNQFAANSPLLDESIAAARQQLALGDKLPQDVQNLVMRTALAHAGQVGGAGGGLGLGRDIAARDLGLTSLDLLNQRIGQAGQLGQAQLGQNQFNSNLASNTTQFNSNNLLNMIQQIQGIGQNQFGRQLSAAQYGQSIQQPNVGLDPSAVANIVAGNATNQSKALANQANIQGQQSQNLLNFGGQLLGYGLTNGGSGSSSTNPNIYGSVSLNNTNGNVTYPYPTK